MSFIQQFKGYSFSDKCLTLLLLLFFCPGFFTFLYAINARIGLGYFNENLIPIVEITLAVLGIKSLHQKLSYWDLLFVTSLGVFCFWSINIYPDTSLVVLLYAPKFVFECLPFFLLGVTIDLAVDQEKCVFIGRLGVVTVVVIRILAMLGAVSSMTELEEEKMGEAYALLPSLILVTWNVIRRYNLIDMILVGVGAFTLISMGSRGPIMAWVMFVSGYLFIFKKFGNDKLVKLLIILGLLLIYLNIDSIIGFMMDVTRSMGMSTRVYESLLDNEIVDSSNRDWVYDAMEKDLKNMKIWGNGFFYDRTLVINPQGVSGYAHNIFFEVFLNFGYYIGFAVLLFFWGIYVWNMKKTWNTDTCSLVFAFLCAFMVVLLFSLSYLTSAGFWLSLGTMVATIRKPKSYFVNR